MHNLSANFGKFLDICNKFGKKFTTAKLEAKIKKNFGTDI